jgi:hypothetical protein
MFLAARNLATPRAPSLIVVFPFSVVVVFAAM